MPNDLRLMFDFGVGTKEKPCVREWDEATGFFEAGWWCVNDHTGCIHNDGHNSCCHEGKSTSPLGGWK
jgi:hypothetical protein